MSWLESCWRKSKFKGVPFERYKYLFRLADDPNHFYELLKREFRSMEQNHKPELQPPVICCRSETSKLFSEENPCKRNATQFIDGEPYCDPCLHLMIELLARLETGRESRQGKTTCCNKHPDQCDCPYDMEIFC